MDQIQGMRIFVRVVEAGTFTRAADSLGLPKGTVTKQIQALESRLHVKLLNRTTRRVTVTPDGAAYFERTARLLNDFDDIEASMTNAQSNPTGRLRIDVGSSMARLVILPALATFCDRYPDIQVDVGVSDRAVDLISDNVDCVIRGGDLTDQSLVARRIGNLPWMTVASPAYLKRYGAPQHPTDIEKRHLVVGFFSGSTRRMFPEEFHRGDEKFEIVGRLPDEADAPFVGGCPGASATAILRAWLICRSVSATSTLAPAGSQPRRGRSRRSGRCCRSTPS